MDKYLNDNGDEFLFCCLWTSKDMLKYVTKLNKQNLKASEWKEESNTRVK